MLSAGLALAFALAAVQADAPAEAEPAVERWLDEGWALLPAYDGGGPRALSDEEAPRARAAAALFQAATELEPESLLAWWRLAHAEALLAFDQQVRGARTGAECARARAALARALEIDAQDPWSHFARAVFETSFGEHALAAAELAAALAGLEHRAGEGAATDAWLRFRALEWQPEVSMRLGLFEQARAELRAFHAEYSTNAWPLAIALAESCEREHDFAAARGHYEAIAADEAFAGDPTAHELLGYLEGLAGNTERALERLEAGLAREREPSLYPRLWLWLLSPPDARGAHARELAAFLEAPPPGASAWDLTLGRFLIEGRAPEAFLEAAEIERRRRLEVGQPLDDLLCEAWFYAGVGFENLALGAEPPAREALARRALAAHGRALGLAPVAWKWEWAYARLRGARLAAELGAAAEPSFELAGGPEGAKLSLGEPRSTLAVLAASWHAPGAERALPDLGRNPRPGDLLLARVLRQDGSPDFARLAVGFE